MGEPRVSVLVPVRDEEQYLGAALDSLSAQSFEDFEVLVVDDGSVDGSPAVAREHARRDPRIRLLRQDRLGVVAALERARGAARGRVLARMDGDDVALPDRLALQVEALQAEGLAACGGGIEYFPAESVRDGSRRYERWLNSLVTAEAAARDVFVECPIPHPTLLARRAAVEAAGGYRDRGWAEDYDLVLRLWARGGRFRNVDAVVVRWRDHPGRLTRTAPQYSLDAFVRCKVHHLRLTLLRGRDAVLVWGAGPVGKAFARELVDQGVSVAAFVDVDPRKLGKRVHGIPVVSVDEAPRGVFALAAVAGEAGRARVRAMAAERGWRDGLDLVAVA